MTFLLLDYYLEFYIRLQQESSNKGDRKPTAIHLQK